MFDLFVSYRRTDAPRVMQLAELLGASGSGLRLWVDQHEIGDFESITDAIREGIAESKALLTWYSADYPKSRPCQQELTAGFIAALSHGDPRRRVLVVNPETSATHVLPIQLADQQHPSTTDLPLLANRIADHVRSLDGPLGAGATAHPSQYGHPLTGSSRFVGRLKDLWAIHSALFARDSAIISGTESPGIAQLTGLGGIGKSLLAEEYALRFGAAFPAGIFWLRAAADHPTATATSEGQLEARRRDQWRSVAVGLGLEVTGLAFDGVEALLAARLRQTDEPFLWIVDDLGAEFSTDTFRRWLAPSSSGRTLITTRSRGYAGIGTQVPLDVLSGDEAFALLTTRRAVAGDEERAAASSLCADLGFHPLGVDVTGSALVAWPSTIAEFKRVLAEPTRDELDLAAELADVLPNGHEKGIATTLLRSIRAVGPEGQDFLRLAARVATLPIPTRLVEDTFQRLPGGGEGQARVATARALAQCAKASLAEGTGDAPRRVHVLLSRTMRFHDADPPRQIAVHEAAVLALIQRLPVVADVRTHAGLALEVLHARTLVGDLEGRPERAELLGWVALHDVERGEYDAAEAASRRQLAAYEAAYGTRDRRTLMAAGDLARALKGNDKAEEAMQIERRVLEERIRLLGPEHRDTLTAMNNLATTMVDLGDREGARSLQQRVLDTRLRLLGPLDEQTLYAFHNLGGTLLDLGQIGDALPLLRQAYEGRRKVLGDDHVSTLISRTMLGIALWKSGDSHAAERHLRETADTVERLQGPMHARTLATKASLGRILIANGKVTEAVDLLGPVVDVTRAKLGDANQTTHAAMSNYGLALALLGRHTEARPLLELALTGRRQRNIQRDWLLASYALNLGETYAALGDVDGVRRLVGGELAWLLEASDSQLEGEMKQDVARARVLAKMAGAATRGTRRS